MVSKIMKKTLAIILALFGCLIYPVATTNAIWNYVSDTWNSGYRGVGEIIGGDLITATLAAMPYAGAARATPAAPAATTTALQPYLPSNNGFIGQTSRQTLRPGQMIDRYGGSAESRFFSPAGTPPELRSLPAGSVNQPLRSFEVMKPFEVEAGRIAPAMNQIGLGTQYFTPVSLEVLLKRGILHEVTR